MSKKRTTEDEPNEDSDPELQQTNNAKRAKPGSKSDAKLQHLPIEMLECILRKAVVMEVKEMKLAKRVWKEKADVVIKRLQTVCSQWNSILTTKFFRNEVHRILHDRAKETIRLEILHQYTIQYPVNAITTLKDEVYLLCQPNHSLGIRDYVIEVYKRNRIAIEVKDVIPLREKNYTSDMVACLVSNCLYVMCWVSRCVLRVSEDEGRLCLVSTWITYEEPWSNLLMSVSVNGNLIVVATLHEVNLRVVYVYNADGSMQTTLKLSTDLLQTNLSNVAHKWLSKILQRPNGNLVLVVAGYECATQLVEIDTTGGIVCQYQSRVTCVSYADFADDNRDRILIGNTNNSIKLLDSELNPLDLVVPKLSSTPLTIHYDSERNEVLRCSSWSILKKTVLTVLRFKEN